MPTSAPSPPARKSSQHKASQLIGKLHLDGTADLRAPSTERRASGPGPMTIDQPSTGSMRTALSIIAAKDGSEGSLESGEEDYDVLQVNPLTVIEGGKGGGFTPAPVVVGSAAAGGAGAGGGDDAAAAAAALLPNAPVTRRPVAKHQKSVTVTLNKLDEEGKYVLIAEDDKDLRQILQDSTDRGPRTGNAKRRGRFSDLVFTRQFTTFDRQNSDSADSPFQGFFVLFWICVAVYVVKLAADNWRKYGHILGTNEIMQLAFRRDVVVLGLSDGVMVGSTALSLVLQRLIDEELVDWSGKGWIVQSIWELIFLGSSVYWTLFREWPWTHTVFFVLHALVMLMKQHSYAFYNGYLSEQHKKRKLLQRRLKQLDGFMPVNRPSSKTPVESLATSYLEHDPSSPTILQQPEVQEDGAQNMAMIHSAIRAGEALNLEQIQIFERILKWEIDALAADLVGKSSERHTSYPRNLTLANFAEYIVLPTVVYELEYPRSDKIDWYYVAEKSVATIGLLGIMNLISQSFIYPVVMQTVAMKEMDMPLWGRLRLFPWILSDLIMPFIAELMLTWYVIWECILNLLAELCCYADRGFYGDWWNSVSWDQYARDWNRPVHVFLLRHVYHSSISTLKVDKRTATLITFFLSAVVHELLMWCLFKKLRGYLLVAQMSQLPLVQLSRTRWLRGRKTLSNIIFWIGLLTGPSLLCSLYLVI